MFAKGDILRILPWDSSPFFTTIWGYGKQYIMKITICDLLTIWDSYHLIAYQFAISPKW